MIIESIYFRNYIPKLQIKIPVPEENQTAQGYNYQKVLLKHLTVINPNPMFVMFSGMTVSLKRGFIDWELYQEISAMCV